MANFTPLDRQFRRHVRTPHSEALRLAKKRQAERQAAIDKAGAERTVEAAERAVSRRKK